MTANPTSYPMTHAKLAQIASGSRTCQACGKTKPLSEFPQHHNARGGVGRRCEQCRSEQLAFSGQARAKTFAIKREAKRRREILAKQGASRTDAFKNLSQRLQLLALDHYDIEVAIISRELDQLVKELEEET